MAGDLRVISSVIHIATELERMADHAAGNAKIALQTADEPLLKPLVDIPRMSDVAREMLTDSITALIQRDAELARTSPPGTTKSMRCTTRSTVSC